MKIHISHSQSILTALNLFTLTLKANERKRIVIASVSDDAVMRMIHHLEVQFQLYLLLFGHLVIVLGQ